MKTLTLLILLLASSVMACDYEAEFDETFNRSTIKVDTTWKKTCEIYLQGKVPKGCFVDVDGYLWRKVTCTTVVEDTSNVARGWTIEILDSLGVYGASYFIKQPLRMKIDTVRVDTVGWNHEYWEFGYSKGKLIYDDSVWVPILKYTTRDYYYLSEEQVEILGGVK